MLIMAGCGELGPPDFEIGYTDFHVYTDAYWPDLDEAMEKMNEAAPPQAFMYDVLLWNKEYSLGESCGREILGVFTSWEWEIEIRVMNPDSPTYYNSLPHEFAHGWNARDCSGDCRSHGAEWYKKYSVLRDAAMKTEYSLYCLQRIDYYASPCGRENITTKLFYADEELD